VNEEGKVIHRRVKSGVAVKIDSGKLKSNLRFFFTKHAVFERFDGEFETLSDGEIKKA
jgi:hypothetical protein